MQTLLDLGKNVTAEISVTIPILKDLPDNGFALNIGALTLKLGKKNFILDSEQTNFKNRQKKGSVITFDTTLGVDLDTFEKDETYNYELTEADLKDKKLTAEFFCSDDDAGIEDAFDFKNAKILCVVTVDGTEYKVKTTFE